MFDLSKMKKNMKKNKITGLLILAVTLFTSCADTNFSAIPVEKLMGDSLKTTFTIQQLLDKYLTNNDVYTDTVGKQAGLFTCDSIKSTSDVIINGIVTSTDVEGNVYKYITIQEPGKNGRAIKVSIDASGLSGLYPLGQRVWIKCNGLSLGKYAQSPQIGIRYVNLDKVKVNVTKTNTVYRIEPGRIPLPVATQAIHTYGMPNPSLVKADTMSIAQIKAAGTAIFNKLVCIPKAFFTGKGANNGYTASIKDSELIFAPSTNGIGYPQSREIQDGTGSMFVSTSEYSKFANTKLPSSTYRGYITAIVGWYNDKDVSISSSKIYHQLTIRSLDDLGKGFEGFHSEINK